MENDMHIQKAVHSAMNILGSIVGDIKGEDDSDILFGAHYFLGRRLGYLSGDDLRGIDSLVIVQLIDMMECFLPKMNQSDPYYGVRGRKALNDLKEVLSAYAE